MDDLISRQAAIDGVKTLHDVAWKNWHQPTLSANFVLDMIRELPSVQAESDNDTEFWRNRAKEYEKMVGELIADMSRGVKFESVEFTENGLVFKKRAEQEWMPCRKGLPKEYGNYLVSIDGEGPDIGTINPNDKRGWGLCDANGFYWASDKMLNITAWMPLPEPYKEDTYEKDL